jgi:erythritol kinase
MRDILVGIDAGTSVIKAVAFSLDGRQIAVAGRRNSYDQPQPGHVEQDMARTADDVAAALRDLAELVPDLSGRIVALGVTAQGDGTWLVDAENKPVGGGLLWLDSRAMPIVEAHMRSPAYARHYALTGSGLNACMSSSQIAWMKQHQPERLVKAARTLHCKDWLYFCLTGAFATDPSEANFTFGNFRTRRYEPEILDAMGIGDCVRLLPPVLDGTVTTHPLTEEAARRTGLPQGLPVALGYIDVVCAALGGGLYDPSVRAGVTVFGTTGMHMGLTPDAEAVTLNESRSGYTMAFPVPGAVSQMQSNMAATLNIDWLLKVAGEAAALGGASLSRDALLAAMDPAVLAARPVSALYHPYIVEAGERGPFLDANARAQFSGLSQETTYAGLMRGVYEGLALAARDCYASMGEVPQEVRIAGGAARSKAIRLILASMLGASVRTVDREETGAAGAVMIASVAIGLHPDMAACARAWIGPALGEATMPDAALAETYQAAFPVYRAIRDHMTAPWAAMAALRRSPAASWS